MADRKRMQFDSRLSDAEWIRLLGEMWDLPAVDLDDIEVIDEVLAIIPKELAKRRSVFPVSLVTEDDEEELILAVADPSDVAARQEAAFVSGRDVVVVVSTHEQIDRAITRSYDRKEKDPDLDDADLSAFLSKNANSPSINLDEVEIDREVLSLCPRKIAEKHGLIPVSRADRTLVVAISDPTNIFARDELLFLTGLNIEFVVASPEAIARAIERFYPRER